MPDQSAYTILVPVSSARQAHNLLPLVVPLALAMDARMALLAVELSHYGRESHPGGDADWLPELKETLTEQGVRVEIQRRSAHHVAGGVREACRGSGSGPFGTHLGASDRSFYIG